MVCCLFKTLGWVTSINFFKNIKDMHVLGKWLLFWQYFSGEKSYVDFVSLATAVQGVITSVFPGSEEPVKEQVKGYLLPSLQFLELTMSVLIVCCCHLHCFHGAHFV